MTDENRIRELLEEVLASGRTPEEVCADCPDLLPLMRARLRQIRRVEQELWALFPPAENQDRSAAGG
jgi:serine/threonine-protein kinase